MFGFVVFGLAVLTVLLTSLIKNVEWSTRTKNIVATVLAAAGAGVAMIVGDASVLNGTADYFKLLVSTYGVSQLIYNFVLRGTTAEEKLAEVKVL